MAEIDNFTPVEESDDSGKWKPLPSEIQASGPEPSAQDILPKADPQVSGGEPTPGDPSADILRYGVPTAAAIGSGGASLPIQMLIGGLSTGASEITARQIERASTDADLDEIWKDIKAGGAVGGADVAITGMLSGLNRGVLAASRKILLPREMPPDIELAQTVLGKGKGAATRLWRKFKGQKDPFSLTLGQLNTEERGLVTFFESVARGGTGRGIMERFDSRNVKHVSELISKYFDMRMERMTPHEMGAFLHKTLGLVDDPTNAIKPVEAFRSFLYKRYDEALDTISHEAIDGSSLRNFIRNSNNKDLMRVYGDAKSSGLLPPLEGIDTKVVKRSRTTTHRTARNEGVTVADVTKQNLLKPGAKPVRSKTQTQATKEAAQSGDVTTERTTELIVDPRLSAEQVDSAWKNLTPSQVDKVIRKINSYYSSNPDHKALNNSLSSMRKQVQRPFDKTLNKYSSIKVARDTANAYFGAKEEALFNDVINNLRKSLVKTPSGVAAILDPTTGNAGVAYDKLQRIKKALFFSGSTPGGVGTQKMQDLYDKSIIRPLRFRAVDAASDQFGRLDPGKFLKQLEDINHNSPEMLKELWGSEVQVEAIKRFTSTYNTLLNSNPEKSIFIQLKQAAALGTLGAATGGMWGFYNGDNPVTSASIGGAAAILISPVVLARALTDPRLTRALTDGLTESTKAGGITPLLAMTFRKMGEMKVASTLFRDNPSTDTMQFYNFAPIEEVEQ